MRVFWILDKLQFSEKFWLKNFKYQPWPIQKNIGVPKTGGDIFSDDATKILIDIFSYERVY